MSTDTPLRIDHRSIQQLMAARSIVQAGIDTFVEQMNALQQDNSTLFADKTEFQKLEPMIFSALRQCQYEKACAELQAASERLQQQQNPSQQAVQQGYQVMQTILKQMH